MRIPVNRHTDTNRVSNFAFDTSGASCGKIRSRQDVPPSMDDYRGRSKTRTCTYSYNSPKSFSSEQKYFLKIDLEITKECKLFQTSEIDFISMKRYMTTFAVNVHSIAIKSYHNIVQMYKKNNMNLNRVHAEFLDDHSCCYFSRLIT